MKHTFLLASLLTVAAAADADTHTVTFRKLNGTVLQTVEVEHGANATALAPAVPAENDMTPQGWDHADWLACVTNDVTCWALYEASTAKSPSTSIASQSVANRETPYSLEEYFQIYDNLAWSDEFSGSALSVGNGKNWQNDTYKNSDELQTYTSGSNHSVSDGTLKLTCKRESSTKITSARINSKGKVAFLKGRCEIRAKITKANGAFPAFWTMGSNRGWPWGGEIDVFEQLNGSDWITGSLHMPLYPNSYSDRTLESGGESLAVPEDGVHWGDGFHRIGIIVNERDLVWYIDDHIYQRMDIRDSKYDILRNDPQYILLNYAFGGSWSGVTNMNQSAVMNFTSEDFVVDYCRIFTNTNADNTVARTEPAGAKLSGPVRATVWRGWQMKWGKSGSNYYQSHIFTRENLQIRIATREYLGRDNADIVTFLTRTTANSGGSNLESPVDVPGYSAIYLSPNSGRGWTDWDGDIRTKLLSTVLFNSDRFSKSDSAVGTLQLSNDYSFTNGCAVVAELVEKDTGAKVKVVSAFVSNISGATTDGSVAKQGFDALISKLDAMKDEKVILLIQGWNNGCLEYLNNRVGSELASSYSSLGQYTNPSYVYQSAWATANYEASAENPAPLSVPKSNGQASGVHTNQSFCATVQFEAVPPVEYGQLDQSAFAKKMTVSFTGYSGATLTDFPVLVKLSTAIDGFSYADFHLSNGGDLRFADASGTLLPHEIDTWNPGGVSTVWVKVPSLTAAAKITAYYGCDEPPPVAAKDVWDDDYVGVWHLGENVLPMKESSGTSVGFTQSSGSGIGLASQGIVGGSVDFGESGKSRALIAPDHNALDGFTQCTFEAWTYVDSTYRASGSDVNKGFLSKRVNYNSQASYYLHDTGSATKFYISNNGTSSTEMSSAVKPDTDTWTHQAYTFDERTSSNNVKGWKNGANVGTASKSVTSVFAGSANLFLGNFSATDARNFPGRIDELRISKVARSAAWIKATHDTVADANFATYTVDGAQPPDPTGTQIDADAFAKSMDLTFSGYSGTELTDFPVLVKLSTAIGGFSYEDFTLPNGGDLRFADASGNLLSHEIDTWNESGVSTIWVKVPRLTATATITAYYGCTGTPQTVSAKDVWDDGYVAVWHLGESAVPMKESSETTSDFTTTNGTGIAFASQGIVGGSVDFVNGSNCSLVAPDHDLLDGFEKFTIEVWTRQDAFGTNLGILSKRNNYMSEAAYYILQSGSQTPLYMQTNSTASSAWIAAPYPTAQAWNHLAYSVDATTTSGNVRSYKNGVTSSPSSKTFTTGAMLSNGRDLVLGNLGKTAGNTFNGKIDEVRISNVVRSGDWIKATHDTVTMASFATYTVNGYQPAEPDRILYINVDAGMTDTLNAALVTEYITNIVKRGAGTFFTSAIPNYTGNFSIEGGMFEVGVQNGAGASGVSNTIYVHDGASLKFTGTVANILSGRKLVFEGAPAQGQPGKFLSEGGWVKIGADMSLELHDDATMAVTGTQRMMLSGADIDLGGHTLTIVGSGRQASFDGSTFRNAGGIVVGQRMTFMHENGLMTFVSPASGTGSVTLLNSATFNLKAAVSAEGWTLYATNGNATVTSNTPRFPQNPNTYGWNGRIVFGESEKLATYGGGSNVSNTVFNMRGGVAGSGTLNVGPGWLNLHSADNTYSGTVIVTGQSADQTASGHVGPGGGGIGLWNGAACFPNASSITFNNSARLAFMDGTVCTVPTVTFAGGSGDTQSVSGGSSASRPTMAGFTKTGAGTLVFDSPVSVTGTGDVQAGTLTVANRVAMGSTVEEMVAPQPVFTTLVFASGTALDLSGNTGFKVANLVGSPVVTNAGVFGVTGSWTLSSPGDVLTVTGENVVLGEDDISGRLAFASGATFTLADEVAFSNAVEAAGADGLVVARARWVLGESNLLGMQLALPTPASSISDRWSLSVGDAGTTLRLKLAPATGYAAWVAEKGVTGGPADKTGEIANAVRYAFDIDPQTDEIGNPPIIQVVMDANGNPGIRSRDLAEGRDDVTFGILATEDLCDWSDTALVPMMKSETDGIWRPAASGTPGYAYPAQMFFKYTIEVQ